jgi:hypothetical protein
MPGDLQLSGDASRAHKPLSSHGDVVGAPKYLDATRANNVKPHEGFVSVMVVHLTPLPAPGAARQLPWSDPSHDEALAGRVI